jgi:prepilin peptidase CpaA
MLPFAPTDIALLAAAVILAGAAVHDIAARTIPNSLVLVIAALGLLVRFAEADLPWGLLAATLVFAAATIAWRFGIMGGGDVKLLAAVALLVPPAAVPSLVLAVALAGGVLGFLYIAMGRLMPARTLSPRPAGPDATVMARALRAEAWRIRRRGPLPYAVAIVAGTFATLAVTGA